MFGQSNKDDMANSEDPQDNGGFVSSAHPDPTTAPEPPTDTSVSAVTPVDEPTLPAPDEAPVTPDVAAESGTPEFGQPFNPGAILPTAEPALANDDTSPITPPASTDALIDIKKEALQQLTPLVDHLDQDPEERFKTTMMMIQAADDQSLIKSAYDAAQKITDEKARAQALLDIVNEINYFTQQETNKA